MAGGGQVCGEGTTPGLLTVQMANILYLALPFLYPSLPFPLLPFSSSPFLPFPFPFLSFLFLLPPFSFSFSPSSVLSFISTSFFYYYPSSLSIIPFLLFLHPFLACFPSSSSSSSSSFLLPFPHLSYRIKSV